MKNISLKNSGISLFQSDFHSFKSENSFFQ